MIIMIALRHKKTGALAIVPQEKVFEFLEAGYYEVGQKQNSAPSEDKPKPKRSRKPKKVNEDKVNEDATDADGSM